MTYELNKNSLLSRFVFWSWGVNERDFSHICPFFWLAIFTILFSPFIVLAKSIRGIFRGIVKVRNKCAEQKKADFEAWAEVYSKDISFDEKKMAFFLANFYLNKNSQMYRFYDEYLPSVNYTFYEKCRKIYDDYIEQKFGNKEAKAIQRRNRITKVVKLTRPITKGVLYLLLASAAVFVAYYIYVFIQYLIHLPKGTLVDYLVAIAVVLGVLAAIIILLAAACKSKAIANALDSFFNWIRRGFRNLGNFLSIFFEENCPPVKWK